MRAAGGASGEWEARVWRAAMHCAAFARAGGPFLEGATGAARLRRTRGSRLAARAPIGRLRALRRRDGPREAARHWTCGRHSRGCAAAARGGGSRVKGALLLTRRQCAAFHSSAWICAHVRETCACRRSCFLVSFRCV